MSQISFALIFFSPFLGLLKLAWGPVIMDIGFESAHLPLFQGVQVCLSLSRKGCRACLNTKP